MFIFNYTILLIINIAFIAMLLYCLVDHATNGLDRNIVV